MVAVPWKQWHWKNAAACSRGTCLQVVPAPWDKDMIQSRQLASKLSVHVHARTRPQESETKFENLPT